ncbi:MAG: energy transducer TonB [Thiotrichales bacterium]|nr:MAG: energy transducer TonB [Thiotrichales bacterium]
MTTVARAPQITDNDRLGMTLFLAAVLHGIVILGITFSISSSADSELLPTLDVILVQTHNPSEADDASYLAQVSQQGGGNSEEQSRPTDLFTAPSLSKNPGVAMATSEQQQASQQQVEKVTMLHQDDSSYRIDTDQEKQNPDDKTRLDRQNQNQNIKQARLAQELSTQIQHLSDTARTKYLNSSTREFAPAAYMRQWINRVERIGNLNYPDQARREKLSGTLILDVVISADGELIKADLRQSSGHQLLDDAARRIVELAAPYSPFPPKLREQADVIHITRSWEFLNDNSLRTN